MKHHLVLTYHSFNDPILKGLLLRYLEHLQKEYPSKHTFHYITFEQLSYKMNACDQKTTKASLHLQNVRWYPITYHSGGRFMIFKKVWDFINALWLVIKLKYAYSIHNIIGFTAVSSVMVMLLAKLLQMKSICLNMEPHSRYMKDFGLWSEHGLKFKLLRKLEQKVYASANCLAVPTQNAAQDEARFRNLSLHFIPTCIDQEDFTYTESGRAELRNKFSIANDTHVVLYLGKFDGIYFSARQFARYMRELEKNTCDKILFFVITPDDINVVEDSFREAGVLNYHIHAGVPFNELSAYLSMADAGILILPEYPSQRYRCPIKTANYLAAGLPIIVNSIVGDEPKLIEKYGVGWILDLEKPEINWKATPDRASCRNAVRKERAISKTTEFLDTALH